MNPIEKVDKNFKKYILKLKFTLQTENRINPCPKTKEKKIKKTDTSCHSCSVCLSLQLSSSKKNPLVVPG